MDSLRFNLLKIYTKYSKKYFQDLKENDRRRLISYLYVIFTLFTVSFFGIFAINPTFSTISNLKKQYDENKVVYNQIIAKKTALQRLDLQYQQIESDLPIIYQAIPTTSKIAFLTRQIEELASDHTISLNKFGVQTTEIFPGQKTKAPLYSFHFSVSVGGQEENVYNFIKDLIHFDRMISLDSVTVGKTQSGSFEVSVSGKAFYYD